MDEGKLIRIKRSQLPLTNSKIQNYILQDGELCYLEKPDAGNVKKGPYLVLGDFNTKNYLPTEKMLKMVDSTIVDNSVYFKDVDIPQDDGTVIKGIELVDDHGSDELKLKNLSVNKVFVNYFNTDTKQTEQAELSPQKSIADEYEVGTTYRIGDIVYYNGSIWRCLKSTSTRPSEDNDAWLKTSLQEYVESCAGSIDSITIVDGRPVIGRLTPDANKNINITIPTKLSYLTNDLGYLNKVFIAQSTAPTSAEDKKLLWVDTTPNTGGLKYWNGSSWVTVPVRWS